MSKLSLAARVAQKFIEKQSQNPLLEEHLSVAPPGWENTVKKMKKHDEIDNPWALAWHMKNKGDKPGGKDKEGGEPMDEDASITRPTPMAADDIIPIDTPMPMEENGKPMSSHFARRKTAGVFLREGSQVRKLESAVIHDSDGGLNLSIYEIRNPPRTASDKPYHYYRLLGSMSHYGSTVEAEFPLGSSGVVRWLIGALNRVLPTVEANESYFQRREYSARPTVMDGLDVPDTRVQLTDSGSGSF